MLTKPLRLKSLDIFLSLTVMSTITMSYVLYGWQLDRESASAMRALDLDVSRPHLGKKKIDGFGRLRRSEGGTIACGEVFSNYQTCVNNVALHTNCLPLCDSSYSGCAGCDVLASDHLDQKTAAQTNCETRRDYTQCPLNFVPGTQNYDYDAVYACCLAAAPPSAPACLCDTQQTAQPACSVCGNCQAATCGVKTGTLEDYYGRKNCPTTFMGPTPPEDTATCCPGVGVTSCDGNGVPQTCGNANGVDYAFNVNIPACVTVPNCPSSLGATAEPNANCLYGNIPSGFGYSYNSCYRAVNKIDNLALLGTGITSTACLQLCQANGVGYCAMTNGGTCRGGTITSFANLSHLNRCTVVCTADTSENCGGVNSYLIWRT